METESGIVGAPLVGAYTCRDLLVGVYYLSGAYLSGRACPGVLVEAYLSGLACRSVLVGACLSGRTCRGLLVGVYLSGLASQINQIQSIIHGLEITDQYLKISWIYYLCYIGR